MSAEASNTSETNCSVKEIPDNSNIQLQDTTNDEEGCSQDNALKSSLKSEGNTKDDLQSNNSIANWRKASSDDELNSRENALKSIKSVADLTSDESDEEELGKGKSLKLKSALVLTSDESDEEINSKENQYKPKSALALTNDDSDDEMVTENSQRSVISDNVDVERKESNDSDDENEKESLKERKINRVKRKYSSDSDSSIDEKITDVPEHSNDNENVDLSPDNSNQENQTACNDHTNYNSLEKSSKIKNRSSSSKGKKNSFSELDEIHKESQRLVRESRVSLPYHIPKQRTLQDFLSRRKAVPIVPLKSSKEDLSAVWKHIEEREKTTASFYESGTEGSDQDDDPTPSSELSESIKTATKSVDSSRVLDSESKDLSTESSCDITQKDHQNKTENVTIESFNIDENAVSSCLFQNKHFRDCNDPNSSVQIEESKNENSIKTNGNLDELKEAELKDEASCTDLINTDLLISDSSSYPPYLDQMKENENSRKTDSNLPVNNEADIAKNIVSNDENSLNTQENLINEQFSSENLTKSLFKTLDSNALNAEKNYVNEVEQSATNTAELKAASIPFFGNSPDLLERVPKLSGGPGDEIDLDQPVVDPSRLLKRFIKHAKLKTSVPKKQATVKLNILNVESVAGGEVSSVAEEEVTIQSQEMKPGQKLSALKQSLKKSIEVTRSQLLAKRIEQYKLYEQEFYEETGNNPKQVDEEFENEIFGDKNDEPNKDSSDSGDEEETSDEELDDVRVKVKPKKKNDFIDEEAEVSEEGGESSDDSNDRAERDYDSQDSLSEKNSKSLKEPSLNESAVSKPDLSGLGLAQDLEEGCDLMDLCSGEFKTQPVSLTQLENDSSQSYSCSVKGVEQDEQDFSQELFTQKSIKNVNLLESDEEDEVINNAQIKVSKLIKQLQFSDDEEEDEAEQELNKNEDCEDPDVLDKGEDDDESNDESSDKGSAVNDEEKVAELKDVQYDSEEEIVEAHNFLDAEAELSGSEWGSADEDERGLSDFEEDQADTEKINQSKVRSELERIHMQEMLADDKREIRYLQELLLEDGDLHSDGPKRQRLFRWSSHGDGNDLGKTNLSDEEGAVDDEEEDDTWRKQRLEREKFLNSTRKDEVENDLEESAVSIPVSDKKTIQRNTSVKVDQHLSPDPKQPFKLLTSRGSFLSRGERVLAKLAGLTAPTEQQQRVKRNMVFSVASPPKQQNDKTIESETEKRKANENLPRVTKKLCLNKTFPKGSRGLGLLEKLREIDQNTS